MILFSIRNERKMEKEREKIRAFKAMKNKKDLVYQNGKQGLKTMRFYFGLNDKRFCSNGGRGGLLKHKKTLIISCS